MPVPGAYGRGARSRRPSGGGTDINATLSPLTHGVTYLFWLAISRSPSGSTSSPDTWTSDLVAASRFEPYLVPVQRPQPQASAPAPRFHQSRWRCRSATLHTALFDQVASYCAAGVSAGELRMARRVSAQALYRQRSGHETPVEKRPSVGKHVFAEDQPTDAATRTTNTDAERAGSDPRTVPTGSQLRSVVSRKASPSRRARRRTTTGK